MRLNVLLLALAALLLCACGGFAEHVVSSPRKGAPGYGPQMEAATFADESDDYGGAMEEPAELMPAPEPQGGDRFANRGETSVDDPQDPSGAPPPPPPPVHDATAPPVDAVHKQAKPLLIYTATYHLAVFETTATIDAVQKLASELGGYLVRRDDRSITIRVPSERFRGALGAISKLGDVLHHEETVRDVTEQFLDMQIRLKNARAMRGRLEELLAAAKDVKEALAVEKELGRVTADIETMEGKLKRLRELIAFSTITVELKPRAIDKVDSKVRLPFPWLDRLGLGNLLNL